MQQEMQLRESGRIRYLVTRTPRHYNMSHSRNIAFLAAQGEIVVNVDADNYIGSGFVAHLNRLTNACCERWLRTASR